jgi:hypothetical protein
LSPPALHKSMVNAAADSEAILAAVMGEKKA